MYKLCERCHFHVPAKNHLCNVCGSQSFSALSADAAHTNIDQTLAALAASTKNVSADMQEHFGVLSTRIGSAMADYGRDLVECGVKVKSAAIKMKNLMVMPTVTASGSAVVASHAANHDDVLSFHKNIVFGRRAKAAQTMETQIESKLDEIQPFTPMLVKPLDPEEFENALKADVEVLKHNLDELKEWFENYGKTDSLLRTKATQLQFSDRERKERHAA